MNTAKLVWTLFVAILASFASAQDGRHGGMRGRGRGGYRVMGGHGGMRGHGGGGRGRGYGYGGGGMGHGGGGGGGGMGHGGGGHGMSRREMMHLIHDLFNSREEISREYNKTDLGIESYTYSGNPDVAKKIQKHVEQMRILMNSNSRGIRLWDDTFYELFELRDYHEIVPVNVTDEAGVNLGVRVEQQVVGGADDMGAANARKCAKSLIQAHADIVSKFINRGRSEMHVNHPVSGDCEVV